MEKRRSYLFSLYLLALVCSTSRAHAEDSLFDLDLKELANVKVTSVSRYEQSIEKAPAIISVITQADIKRYGANNLFDALQYFPGFLSLRDTTTGKSGLSLRGDSNLTSERILTLIDGKPYRSMASSGYVVNTLYQTFPLAGVERIELIRGPSSMMYGTTAVTAVVNIVTRKASATATSSTGELSAQVGSFDSHQESLFWAGNTDNTSEDPWRLSMAANQYHGNDWSERGTNGFTPFNYEYLSTGNSVLIDAQREHYYIKTLLMEMDTNYPAPTQNITEDFKKAQHIYYDMGYNNDINEQWRFDTHYSLLRINDSNLDVENQEDLIEVNLFGDLSQQTRLQSGFTFNKSSVYSDNKNVRGLGNYPDFQGGVYTQLNHDFSSTWSGYAGLQWNKSEGNAGHTSPRLGVIYSKDQHSGAKILYSEAFRLPTATEANLNFTVPPLGLAFIENPQLNSETVKTLDMQWFHYEKNAEYTITAFYSEYQSRISNQDVIISFFPVPTVVKPGQFVQTGSLHVYGLEWEGKFALSSQDQLTNNLVLQTNENDAGVHNTTQMPRWIASLGYSHTFNGGAVWSVFEQHVSAFANQGGGAVVSPNPTSSSYDLLSTQLTIPLPIQMSDKKLAEFFVRGTNLLNEEVWQPNLAVHSINTIPMQEGRAVYTGFRLNW